MLALAVFVKNNILGRAKTRIAKDVGAEKAYDIYNSLLQYTHHVVSSVPVHKCVYYSDHIEEEGIWKDELFSKKLQAGVDLGRRMQSAFRSLLQSNKKVVLIGSDCAQLKTHHILRAYDTLDKYDVVLGPTYDGGYYLVGMRKDASVIFENMEWSHDQVLSQTLDRLASSGYSYYLLEKLHDVDYWEDVKKHCKHLHASGS